MRERNNILREWYSIPRELNIIAVERSIYFMGRNKMTISLERNSISREGKDNYILHTPSGAPYAIW